MHPEPITEAEVQAYLDGELDLHRRLAVETHFIEHPEDAGRFFEDLRLRTSLRLLTSELDDIPTSMRQAATRLASRFEDRPARGFRHLLGGRIVHGLAAAALLAMVILPARDVMANPPEYVGDAIEAYRTGLLRATMVSQVETPAFDASEVRRSTRIRMPRLPEKWVVTDAQIFPSKEGPALQLMIRTPSDRRLSIFAIRAKSDAPAQPEAIRHDNGTSVAYWREGDMSYALTGGEEPEALDVIAEDLADPEEPLLS